MRAAENVGFAMRVKRYQSAGLRRPLIMDASFL